MDITQIHLYKGREFLGTLDTDASTIVPLNFSIADIRDISKKRGTFSKSITLPGTKNNNVLLNNYYDVNIHKGTFDVNKIVNCTIVRDGIIILDNAILQLVSVNKREENGVANGMVTYTVLVKDTTSDFFTTISNKYLNDIDMSDITDHVYTADAVIDSFDNTVDDGYKYIMPFNSANLDTAAVDSQFLLNEFTPGIYAKTYWDKIFNEAGYTYNWPELDDPSIQFSKLIIPYNGDVPRTDKEDSDLYKAKATGTTQTHVANSLSQTQMTAFGAVTNTMPTLSNNNVDVQISAPTEVLDPSGNYNTSTSTFTTPFLPSITNNVKVKITAEWEAYVQNDSGNVAYLVGSRNANFPSNTTTLTNINPVGTSQFRFLYVTPQIGIRRDGALQTSLNLLNSPIQLLTGSAYPVGKTVIDTATSIVEFTINGINGSDDINIWERLNISALTGSNNLWRFYNVLNPTVVLSNVPNTNLVTQCNIRYRILSLTVEYVCELDGEYGYNVPINMNRFVPQKIKQSDFVKSILTMFNLYVETNREQPNILNIYTRDGYYDSGAAKDWTNKLDKSKGVDIKFIPEIANKRQLITYKEDSDWANKRYKDATNEIYGQAEYVYQNEYVKDTTKTEVIFSPTPTANTTWGAVLPIWNGQAPKTNIRILYDGGELPCGSFSIENYPGNTVTGTTYPYINHWDKPINPDFDLNFLPCDFYFRSDDWGNNTNNNLFNLHWRRTLQQIDTGKILTGEFHLSPNDIQSLKLNDKIRIDNSWWIINKIQDYDANSDELTKVELLSLESQAKIPFIERSTAKLSASSPYFDVLASLARDKQRYINTVLSDGDITIKGRGNYIAPGVSSANVIGNENVVNSDAIVSGSNNEVLSPAIVQGSNNIVPNDVENVIVIGSGIQVTQSESLNVLNLNIPATGTINGQPAENNPLVNPLFEPGSGTESVQQINTSNPNNASGTYAIALGTATLASGLGALTEGNATIASGLCSHAEGSNTQSSGDYSHAGGEYNTAATYAETVIGHYAESITGNATGIDTDDPVLRVGNGASTVARSDAFRVYKNGASYLKPIDPTTVTTPQIGMIVFDSITNSLKIWNGTAWVSTSNTSNPKIYRATILAQPGTASPLYENSIGTVTINPFVWSSGSNYTLNITSSGLFTTNKTFVTANIINLTTAGTWTPPTDLSRFVRITQPDANTIQLFWTTGVVTTDAWAFTLNVEILVYP